MHKRGLCRHAVSVCLSVCLSVTLVGCVEMNKYIFIIFSSSGSHTILVFHTKHHGSIMTGTPERGTSNAGLVSRKRDSRPISGYRIDECWSSNSNCDYPPCSLPHRRRRISESCLSQPAWTTTMMRREQNRMLTQR